MVNGRAFSGAESELQTEMGMSEHSVPWEVIAPRRLEDHTEHRADAVTAAPTNSHLIQHPILARVFARSATMTLGVATPMVPTGDQNYPVLTSAATG